ncbi:MAG: aminotransferase class V-fold PLP-dependent enzyme, partial [Kiritimatiellaceae bacterium]|nr:aminotransferase class V-fold PLP-dependent enzyme [Kiritimatiellaceae bacterium]
MSTLAKQIRADFPILERDVNGQPLTYLDSAAASLKPLQVIEAVETFYRERPANVHRGVHSLSREATAAYEGAREAVRAFLNARRVEEIVFTSGTTAAINLVARSWGALNLGKGDEVLLTQMEHHSNIVPWKILSHEKGFKVKVLPVTDRGELDLDVLPELLSSRTKLVALTQVSNTLGTINPVSEVIEAAHAQGALVLLDSAQAVPCMPVDVQDLDCDFLAFSGHKLFGPTG